MTGVVDGGGEILENKGKDSRIAKEVKRISLLLKDSDKNRLNAAKPLIQNAAFMAITLADLQDIINIKGCVEEYQNGANQKGFKKTSEVEVYNVMIKNYASVTKQISEMVPSGKTNGSELLDFVRGGAK
jgi:glutamine phosphoribosylpyrophosphate amidotransferase